MSATANDDGSPEFEIRINEIYAEYSASSSPEDNRQAAAIYVRTSGEGEKSLEDQLRFALGLSVQEGVSVHREHIYYDSGCGKQDVRDGLRSLKNLLGQGNVKIVIIISLDRLYRDQSELQEFLAEYTGKLAILFIQANSDKGWSDTPGQQFVVVKEQAVLVRKIFDMIANGMSIDEVTVSLNTDA